MIAFALMSLVFAGVILAHFGSAYWAIAAQTNSEGLYKAKTRIEELRAVVKKDFRLASSSSMARISDTACDAGGLCYYLTTKVDDLSPCSKYVTAEIDWQVPGYPTTTTSLFTNLTDTGEAINLGGDCPLTTPAGAWGSITQSVSFDVSGAVPTGIDTLGGISYISSSASPYFAAAKSTGFISFANSFAPMDPLNAIEVARDLSTGRTYGYAAIASTTVGFEVLDLTDSNSPSSVAKLALSGVDKNGSYPQGWRLAYYDRKVYIATRETTGPEFHIIDVSNPGNPVEVGSRELNTSVYGMVVRDVKQGSTLKRLAFLATTNNTKEFMALDVTTPSSITELAGAATDLPGSYESRSIFLAGNTVYVGRVSNTGAELYALNASNIYGATSGLTTISSKEIGGDVLSVRVAEPYVFLATTKSGGQVQVLSESSGVFGASVATYNVSGLLGGLDTEGDSVYVAVQSTPRLRVLKSN